MIENLISRMTKIMGGDKRNARIEDLMLKAYEAGRRDAVKDVVITLEDDMINDDHSAAIELITANC